MVRALVDAPRSSWEELHQRSSRDEISCWWTSAMQFIVVSIKARHLMSSKSCSLDLVIREALKEHWCSRWGTCGVSPVHLKPSKPQDLHCRLALLTGGRGTLSAYFRLCPV